MMVRFNPTSGRHANGDAVGTVRARVRHHARIRTRASAEPAADPRHRDREPAQRLRARRSSMRPASAPGRIKVRIVQNDAFNAFVLDGRNVFVHTGTLMQAQTPNEVIGVIAHETGHITGGHMAALRARIAKDQTRALLAQILGIGLMVAGGVAGGDAANDLGGAGPGHHVRWQRDRDALAAGRAAPAGIGGRPGGPHLPQRDQAVRPRHARDVRALRASRNTSRTRRRTPGPAAIPSPPTASRACASSSSRAPTFRRRTRRSCSCATT